MTILHIHEEQDEDVSKFLDEKNRHIDFFIFIFMDGCGHCKEAEPQWKKFESSPYKTKEDVMIVDVNEKLLNSLKMPELEKDIVGFPTFRHMKNGKVEDYDKAKYLKKKDRSYDSFLEWVEKKTKDAEKRKTQGGGGMKKRRTIKKRRIYGGAKWSMKYKRSINCRRPKGFSQRQHCKYGRKK